MSAAAAPSRLDVIDTFGPLASMHAALDRAGVGARCGVVAWFEGRTAPQVEAAIATAQARFPVLRMDLAWQGDRAVLQATSGGDDSECELWTHALTTDGKGVWLTAQWRHAVADGHSMLRFLKTVAAALEGAPAPVFAPQARAPSPPRSMARWLPGFVALQARRYLRIDPPGDAARLGTTWLAASPRDRDRIRHEASKYGGGFVGPLAAAAAMGVGGGADDRRGGLVLLNIPILRGDLEAVGGFGFGVGSVMFPVRVGRATDMARLSQHIGKRCQRLANQGWDGNLNRFLGEKPKRHHAFAGIRARRRPDPAITVSWKGLHDLGAGVKHVACFAGSPALHVSAHADEHGLSISLTSWQSTADRTRLLADIAQRLGIDGAPVFQLSDVAGNER